MYHAEEDLPVTAAFSRAAHALLDLAAKPLEKAWAAIDRFCGIENVP